jgi:hypothetical protein
MVAYANGMLATAATDPEDRRILAAAEPDDFSTAISGTQLPPATDTFEQRWGAPSSSLDWRYELANMDPRERDLLYRNTKAEVGDQSALQQARYMESVVNRLHSARTLINPNISLSQMIAGSVRVPGLGNIGGQYYYPTSTKRKMSAGPLSDEQTAFYDQLFSHVTGDRNAWRAPSNYCNFCTGNESAGVRSGGAPIVARGTQRGDYERYVQENWTGPWVRQMQGFAPTPAGAGTPLPSVPSADSVARAGSSPTVAEGSDGGSMSSLKNSMLAAALLPYYGGEDKTEMTGRALTNVLSKMQMQVPQSRPVDYRSFFRAAAPAQMQAGGRIIGRAVQRVAPLIEDVGEEAGSRLYSRMPSPAAELAYPMLSTATEDPFERAALRQRETVKPSRGRAYSQAQEQALQFLAPQSPLDWALYAATMGPTGRLLSWPAKAGLIGLGGVFGLGGTDPARAPELPHMQGGGRVVKAVSELAPRLLKYLQARPMSPELANEILFSTERGGATVQPFTGAQPTSGLMVGKYPNVEVPADPRDLYLRNLVLSGRPLTTSDLQAFVERNRPELTAANRYLGTWSDPETMKTYLDVAQRFDPEAIRTATKFGERTGQLAGYNIGTQQPFPVGNWPEFIQGPEYHQRLREMAGIGREYLSQFPAKEWWDMYGGPFERVYGQQNLPYVAGYTASTAPTLAPRPNLQQMSEYMRRQLAGEPIIQPEWRTPAGGMTYSPGKLMPMEQSRALNLERTSRGALGELSRAKVREEAAAMTGDPNAVVIDRHHIRLSEAPERGIYASTEDGTIHSVPLKEAANDYDRLQAEIMNEAYDAKRHPRDFSADVWTGIRETIKRNSELYGTKYRGEAIAGESKSYADHFEDLLADKAKHMGISQARLEQGLRGGDLNLMSYVLATTPAAAAAYQQWRASPQPSDGSTPYSGPSQPGGGQL